jgi:hypothetical protein
LEAGFGCKIWGREGWTTNRPWGAHGCGVWKNISMGWDGFSSHIGFDVGIGNRFFSGMTVCVLIVP